MIQGGCPVGQGFGGPGYAFDDEISPDKDFTKPYMLAMANAGKRMGKGTNGSQFFITTAPTTWLQGKHTIFGEVADGPSREVVDKIGAVATGANDKPRRGRRPQLGHHRGLSTMHDPGARPNGRASAYRRDGRESIVRQRSGQPPGVPGPAERPCRPARVPAPPRPRVLRALPALRPADLPGVPAARRRRHPVRRLRARGGADRRRPPRTVFGGRATDGTPVVTYTIIGICAVVYLAPARRLRRHAALRVHRRRSAGRAVALRSPRPSCTRRRHCLPHPAQHVRAVVARASTSSRCSGGPASRRST